MPRSEYAGSFLFGRRQNNRPEPLDRWRIVSNEWEVGDGVREILGGKIEGPNGGDSREIEVLADVANVQILLDGTESVRLEMILWGSSGVVHHCDGQVHLSPVDKYGIPCGCPPGISERKSNAKNGMGPQPSTEISFRLAKRPNLGSFSFRSNSWGFFESANSLKATLLEGRCGVLCDLLIEAVELKSKGGVALAYFRPDVAVSESSPRTHG
ncbi:recombination directionality factor [Streptomyces sp. NPDC001118]